MRTVLVTDSQNLIGLSDSSLIEAISKLHVAEPCPCNEYLVIPPYMHSHLYIISNPWIMQRKIWLRRKRK